MRGLRCFSLVMVFILGVTMVDAKIVSRSQAKSFLPDTFNGWRLDDGIRVFNRKNIFEYMNGAGEFYLAYDFIELHVAEYSHPDSQPVLVEIYRFNSSEDAFGVYHYDLDGEKLSLGADSLYDQGFFKGWKNNIFVRIVSLEETPQNKEFTYALAARIFKEVRENGARPSLLDRLPSLKRIALSERYFHKYISLNYLYFLADTNILHLSAGTNAVLALYQQQENKARLFLFEYPKPAAAREAYLSFNKVYLADYAAPETNEVIRSVENKQLVGVKQAGRYLCLIFEGDKAFIKEVFATVD